MVRAVESPASANIRKGEWLLIAGLMIVTLVVHAASPVTTSTDSAWTFHLAASILREGNVNLDEYRPLMDLALDYRLRSIGSHIYYYYPAATPLLVAPAVLLANALLPLRGSADLYTYLDSHAPDDRTARLEKLVASAIVAFAAVLMYLVARQFGSRASSLLIAFIFAFGTSMWSTASRALWQHGPSVLLALVALYLTLAVPGRAWSIFTAGLVLAFAYLVRPTNSLSFAFFGLYYLLNQRRRFWAFLLGGLVVLVPYVAANLAAYGNIFPPYSYQLFERLATPPVFAEALAGTLVSPNRGLFIFTPVFLFSVYGAVLAVRDSGLVQQNLNLYLLAIVTAHWITTSLFEDWGGAWSIGPRYFVDIIPYLVFLLLPVIASPAIRQSAWKFVFIATIGIGVVIQLRCAVSPYPFLWNGKPQALVEAPERKWDWTDLQFLRGLCPTNPAEGMAPACWMDHIG
ncbi:MAG TPA: hypothetical protein VIU38_12175 [Anaerolineales bacterium]